MFHSKACFLYSLIVLSFFTSCQPKDTFDWNAGLSSPKYYSAAPFVEYFYQGTSIAGASTNIGMGQGWGVTMGGYVGGDKFKPVPDSIFVRWSCGIDDILYEGGYKLPREKMIGLFKKDVIDPFGHRVKYGLITSGMAPGGNVTIWLQGGSASTEICKFKVKDTGKWMKENKEYQEFKNKVENSEEYINSETNIVHYLHGVPYNIWETGEKEFKYDIGFTCEDKNKQDYSIAIAGYTKDGSVIYSNEDPIPYRNWDEKINLEVKKNKKLPVQLWVRWHSRDGLQWYETEAILPDNLKDQFLQFQKENGNDIFLIVGMNKVSENESYTFGKIWLENSKGKIEIMKFRAAKFNIKKNDFEVSKYSLPKDYVFPKWEGREPLTKPTDFEYWQEK